MKVVVTVSDSLTKYKEQPPWQNISSRLLLNHKFQIVWWNSGGSHNLIADNSSVCCWQDTAVFQLSQLNNRFPPADILIVVQLLSSSIKAFTNLIDIFTVLVDADLYSYHLWIHICIDLDSYLYIFGIIFAQIWNHMFTKLVFQTHVCSLFNVAFDWIGSSSRVFCGFALICT